MLPYEYTAAVFWCAIGNPLNLLFDVSESRVKDLAVFANGAGRLVLDDQKGADIK